ncbi:MAG: SMC-Scp complex subunit ScpB [Candidatus Paceibacterota bacterium]
MDLNKKQLGNLEALLFQYGEPISVKKILEILKIKDEEFRNLVQSFKEELSKEGRGLTLIEKDGLIQLMTKPELEEITSQLTKNEFNQELTPATLEVLSIVAYLGPVSKMDVDFIRGVNSSFTLRNLMMRGLIEREKIGNSYSYKASFDFLKHLGLEKVEDLPEYESYKNILNEYNLTN